MKKMFLTAIVLIMSQVTLAAGLPEATITKRVQPYVERIQKAKEGKTFEEFKNDPQVKNAIASEINKAMSLTTGGRTENIMILLHVGDAQAVISEVVKQTSIIKDKTASDIEIKQAKLALELLSLSANGLSLITKKGAVNEVENVSLAIQASERISKFSDYNSTRAVKFVELYKNALLENKTVEQAIKEASDKSKEKIEDKNITKEDLNCKA